MWATSIPFGASRCCRGCDHPRPAYNGAYGSTRSNLGTMLSNAKFIGCEICAILSEGVLKFIEEDGEVSREDVDELRIDFNFAGTRRSIEVVLLNTPIALSFFCSERTPWIAENLPDLPVGNEIPPTTSAEESATWAIRQLEQCRQSHEACSTSSSSALPRRVLDVFAEGESGIRLYESNGEIAPYTCLSHCWGRKPFLRTLSGSLDAHKDEIVWFRLPRTFQDAIEFTRKLGIRYLWIDSLCIIQDDQCDWRREAAKMASIYRNATLVISAARSQGANEGLYAELSPKFRTHTITFTPESLNAMDLSYDEDPATSPPTQPTETIHVRRTLAHPQRLLSPYHAQSTPLLPIFTRGWILQERFLSPRILHFSAHELHFECLASATCQCSTPSSTPSTPSTQHQQQLQPAAPAWYNHMLDRSARPKHYYSLTTWQSGSMSDVDIAVCWRRLVEDYMRLRLTFEKDVFPAISGMAQLMQLVRKGSNGQVVRYLAGLWWEEREAAKKKLTTEGEIDRDDDKTAQEEDTAFIQDLLWHIELPPEPLSPSLSSSTSTSSSPNLDDRDHPPPWSQTWHIRPSPWRAPSWSWASVKSPIEFLNTQEGVEPSCQILDAACAPVGPDTLGELQEGGGYLVVKGRLIPAVLRFKHKGGKEGEGKGEGAIRPWDLIDLDILDGGHMKNLWADDDCQSLVKENGEPMRVYVLLVGRKLPRRGLLCLVLARVSADDSSAAQSRRADEDPHVYRRIGMLEVFGGPPSPVLWGWVHNLLGKGEDKVIRIV